MKLLLYIATVFMVLPVFSCTKELNTTATVIIDCTGTYLRWGGKDYKVCNLETVSSFPNGAKVTASVKKIEECTGSGKFPIICYLHHEYDSWIDVEKIK